MFAKIYTLSLHDALPISAPAMEPSLIVPEPAAAEEDDKQHLEPIPAGEEIQYDEPTADRKSTRLNSSHGYTSYAVFCLKKKTILIFKSSNYIHKSHIKCK